MEKLIKEAVKALEENSGFNEITLSDGANTVHLVKYTPVPTTASPVYQEPYQPYSVY